MTKEAGVTAKGNAQGVATISAKIIRADGTQEDLGVISGVSPVEIKQALTALKPIREAHPADTEAEAIERAHAANAAESERNEQHNARQTKGER